MTHVFSGMPGEFILASWVIAGILLIGGVIFSLRDRLAK